MLSAATRAAVRNCRRCARRASQSSGSQSHRKAATGLAVITITPDGENSIVVAAGANALVAPIEECTADVVVAQTEIPDSRGGFGGSTG